MPIVHILFSAYIYIWYISGIFTAHILRLIYGFPFLSQSKYKLQLIPLLNSEPYKNNLKQIGREIIDCEERMLFKEFLRIIDDYLEREACFINGSQSDNMSIERDSVHDAFPAGNEKDEELDPR